MRFILSAYIHLGVQNLPCKLEPKWVPSIVQHGRGAGCCGTTYSKYDLRRGYSNQEGGYKGRTQYQGE